VTLVVAEAVVAAEKDISVGAVTTGAGALIVTVLELAITVPATLPVLKENPPVQEPVEGPTAVVLKLPLDPEPTLPSFGLNLLLTPVVPVLL
jgi:hypothetical protein